MRALLLVSIAALVMSGCSPMNSEFSCNATAGDSCMTIEQVDAMTRYADGSGRHHARTPLPHRGAQIQEKGRNRSLVWVKKPTQHSREFV